MPVTIPSIKTLAERCATAFEAGAEAVFSAKGVTWSAQKLSFAVRSARGMLALTFRSVAPEIRAIHDHVAWWGRQYFPDTAEEELVYRHASIWNVDGREAGFAVGSVTITGTPGTVLADELELSSSEGLIWLTDAAATIGAGGTVVVSATAAGAGAAYNYEAGIKLTTVEPNPDVTSIEIVTAFAGGADESTWEELQAAVVEHIRKPPQGGAGYDYVAWVKAKFKVAAVKVIPEVLGRGSVGIVVAMKDDDGTVRSPTDPEREAILAYLGVFQSAGGVRPVTARVSVHAAAIVAQPASIRLRPDNAKTRAAVEEAFKRFWAVLGSPEDDGNESPIGATIERSRLSEEISAADGEYAHDLVGPTASYTLDNYTYPVAGAITWVAP